MIGALIDAAAAERISAMIAEQDAAARLSIGPALTTLLPRYRSLWDATTSSAERRRISAEIWEVDGTYCDSMTDTLSPAALVTHIEETILPLLGAYTLTLIDRPRFHGRFVTFAWAFLDGSGSIAPIVGAAGVDFVTVSADAKLARIVGFFDDNG